MDITKLMSENKKVINNLSLTSQDYFDLWHLHVTDRSYEIETFEERIEIIDCLIELFNNLQKKLYQYQSEFQIWILVSEDDANEDAVYVHSKNPYSNNFPIKINPVSDCFKNQKLKNYLKNLEFNCVQIKQNGQCFYMLYKNKVGLNFS